MAYTKYSLTPGNNTAAPPDGAPEGMLPSAVNDTMRDMMAQIRDVGDGIRGGTYTMTAPVITGGSISGASVSSTNLAYTGTLTGGTGVVNLGSGQFYKDASGNVGIGTTSPSSKLHASGVITSGVSGGADGSLVLKRASDGLSVGDLTIDTANSILKLNTAYSLLTFGTEGTEKVRIIANGNVGIGTSSPVTKLEIQSTTGLAYKVKRTSSGCAGGIGAGAATQGLAIFTTNFYANTPIIFGFNQTDSSENPFLGLDEKMRIDSSGNLGLGGQNSSGKFYLQFNPATNNGLLFGVESGTFTNNYIYFQNSGGSKIGSVSSNNASVTYNTTSDYRVKQNIQPMVGALAKIAQLKPVTYDWNPDFAEGSSQGFIAHELQAVVPECVTGEKDAIDAKGKPVYQGVDNSFLIATLTAAIQEQQALIQNLTTRLNALEGK